VAEFYYVMHGEGTATVSAHGTSSEVAPSQEGDAIHDRALVTVVPHTTSLRGSSFEIAVQVPLLKPGAFLVQGVTNVPDR
jgi:mRNA-degrading endonuclease toxin of MazEF toxin-antitoxin module